MSNIGEIVDRISSLVKQNGYTGEFIGSMLGLKKSPLTDWKNQKAKPTITQLITICDKFAVSADYLLFGKITSSNKTSDLTDGENELLSNYKKLDSRGKHKLQTIVYEELDRIEEKLLKETQPSKEDVSLSTSTIEKNNTA